MDDRAADFTAYASGRWASLVRSAVMLGCTQPDAEDLAQTALVKAWTHWPKVRQAAEPDAYVYRIMVNALSTSRRRRWHGERPTERLDVESGGDDQEAGIVLRHAVVDALRALSPDQRQVLVLRFVADLSERATAEVLGVAVGTVKSRTSRALAALDPAPLADHAGGES